jgi:hypothetical protein
MSQEQKLSLAQRRALEKQQRFENLDSRRGVPPVMNPMRGGQQYPAGVRQQKLALADNRALEEEAERANPLEGGMHCVGGSQVPSMGLSQFRGGRRKNPLGPMASSKQGKEQLAIVKKQSEEAQHRIKEAQKVPEALAAISSKENVKRLADVGSKIPGVGKIFDVLKPVAETAIDLAGGAKHGKQLMDHLKKVKGEQYAKEFMEGMGNEPSRIAPAPVEKSKHGKGMSGGVDEPTTPPRQQAQQPTTPPPRQVQQPRTPQRVRRTPQRIPRLQPLNRNLEHPIEPLELDSARTIEYEAEEEVGKGRRKIKGGFGTGAYEGQGMAGGVRRLRRAEEYEAPVAPVDTAADIEIEMRRRLQEEMQRRLEEPRQRRQGRKKTTELKKAMVQQPRREGAGAVDKRKARGAMISKLMKEKGMSLAEASKHLKQHGSV